MIIFTEKIDHIIYACLIFIFFLIFKTIVRKTILKLLEKITAKTHNTIDDEVIRVIKKPFDFFFILLGIKLSLDFLNLEGNLEIYVNTATKSLFTFILFWTILRMITPISLVIVKTNAKIRGKELGKDLANLLTKTLQVIVISLGFVTILQELGYNITGFLASLGLIGMAIALAAKDTVANLFGSLVIFSDKPFGVGDWIKTDDVEGTIETVGIRSTKVRTFAQALVSVPNATLANSSILNWSRMGKRRIKTTLGLTYGTSNEQLQKIIEEIKNMLKHDQDIHQETIYIFFNDFQDSSLGIFCYFFTKTTNWEEYMRVREKVNFKIIKIVEKNGSSFAFPTQSIYIENKKEIN